MGMDVAMTDASKLAASMIVATALIGTPAAAADAAMITKAPARTQAIGWSGCHLGANAGTSWGSSHWTYPGPAIDLESHSVRGQQVGGQVGCDLQAGPLVFGFEGQLDWANLSGEHLYVPQGDTYRTRLDWIGTATGRVGIAVDRALVYVKGGFAAAGARYDVLGTTITGAATRRGWTVGGGLEYALTANWSARIEYAHSDFGTADVRMCTAGGGCSVFAMGDEVDTVSLGISYRFPFQTGAIAARY